MAVWLVDHGTHAGLGAVSRARSAEAAARSVRARFGPPFRVRWQPLDFSPDGDEAVLVGEFAPGPGFPSGHTACFCLTRADVPAGARARPGAG